MPPTPYHLSCLNPNASPEHLTSIFTAEPRGWMRCPSIKTPVLHQREPLGGSQDSELLMLSYRHSLAPFFPQCPINPVSGGVPRVNLHAWQNSALWSAYLGPLLLLGPFVGTEPPARGGYNIRPDHRPAGSDLTEHSPDSNSCFISYFRAPKL